MHDILSKYLAVIDILLEKTIHMKNVCRTKTNREHTYRLYVLLQCETAKISEEKQACSTSVYLHSLLLRCYLEISDNVLLSSCTVGLRSYLNREKFYL